MVLAAKDGDARARARLVEHFRPLVGGAALGYRSCPAVERSDLMQEGVVGLLRALERYDPGQDTPFWAYATWWVRQAMQRLVAELGHPVVMSDRALRQLARVKEARRAHLQRHSAEPTNAALAAATGLTRVQVEQLVAAERTPRRLDEPLGRRDEPTTTFGDMLSDPTAEDDYDRVDTRLEIEQRRGHLDELSDSERGVLRARFGLGCRAETLREIGGRLGLSAERVRQIEQHALCALRGG